MQWFRYYHEALDDPKVQRCSDVAFRCWVNLMSLACRHEGDLPPLDDAAFCLRMDPDKLRGVLKELGDLVTVRGDRITITNWNKRQFRSDNSTERSKKHRQRRVQQDCNVAATPPETDTETETDISVPSEHLSAKADDVDEVYRLWNDLAEEYSLPKARKTQGPSLKNVRCRLKEHGLAGWQAAFDGVRGSPHHQGQNDGGWRADLPWLALPRNFEKLMMRGETYGQSGGPAAKRKHNPRLEASRAGMAAALRSKV